MRILLVYSFWVLLCLPLQAQQNLVPNGDFEQYTSCPDQFHGIDLYVPYWFSPLSLVSLDFVGSSDYYHECGIVMLAPSTSYWGVQAPKSGVAFAGICIGQYIYTLDWNGAEYWDEYREYIEIALISTLKPGNRYCYEFFYSIAEKYSEYYIPVTLGILLTDTIVKRNMYAYYYSNGYKYSFPKPISSDLAFQDSTNTWLDTDQWFKIEGEFIAHGGEKYLTLGNFGPEDTTNKRLVYVYIDDVSLWLCEEEPEPLPELLVVYPNPAHEEINFGFSSIPDNESALLEIFTRHGQLVGKHSLNSGIDQARIFTSHLSQGIYLARLSYSTGEQAAVKFMIRH